jgi:hypothetical protein
MRMRGCLLAWLPCSLFLGVWMAGASAAPLGDNTVRLSPSQLKLPQNIGPLRYSGENRFSDRRLGRSFGYNTSGISLSIYVYDYGVRDIPDGDSAPLCEQFESAKLEIERGGNYENVVLRGEFTRPLAGQTGGPDDTEPASTAGLVAREALYEFDRHGMHAVSVLWLTAVDGHFLKLRLSLRSEVADELDEARAQILAAMAQAIEDRRPRRTRDAMPPPQEASIEVDASDDPETAALWFTYATHLVGFTREHPHTRPPCGGPLDAGFAAELAARRAALEQYRRRSVTARGSNYFDQLMRIDDAGFLDEYVWHYLRNERWDAVPPADLDLPSFDRFRERELGTHHVQSGARVRINTVRALPSAPAPR